MPLHVPSKLFISVSTIVSTFISLLAGYLLYAESISVLRSAVDDTSAGASKSARLRLAGMLESVVDTATEGLLLFNRSDVMNLSLGLEYISQVYSAHKFAALRSTEYHYGGGYHIAKLGSPPWEDIEGYGGRFIWYDPVLEVNGSEAKYWLGGTAMGQLNSSNNSEIIWTRYNTAMDNETGAPAPEVFSETFVEDPRVWVNMMATVPKEGEWTPTYFWNAIDGSPYLYTGYHSRHTLPVAPGGTPYEIVLNSWFTFRPWSSVIREFSTANTELLILDSSAGQVFAHTIHNGPAIKFECYTRCFNCDNRQSAECFLHPSELGPTVSGAVNSSKVRPRGTFFTADLSSTNMRIHIRYGEYFAASDVNKTTPLYKKDYFVDGSLDGGEYFLRLTHVYTASDTTFELLWMRSVSSVNDKVYAALVQLIIASVVIFVVDLIIAVLEIVLIARPLGRLVVGNRFLETMELDDATAHMKSMYKPVMVQEVARVTDGLLMAIEGLREYKAFLPNTLFIDVDNKEDADIDTQNDERSTVDTTSVSQRSAPVAGQNLSMHLQKYKGTVVRLSVITRDSDIPDCFGALVETMQELATATRGIAHGFSVSDPLVFTLTWNMGLRCSDAIMKAVTFCKLMSCSEKVSAIAVPSMAVVHGEFTAGNLGSATHKGFGMNGSPLLELRGISAVADFVSKTLARSVTLVSPPVAEGVANNYRIQAVTIIDIDGLKNQFIVHEVKHEVVGREEEWMYQLEEAYTVDPVGDMLKKILAQPESEAEVVDILEPTDLQTWSMKNISEGQAVMSFSQAAVW